MVWTISGVDPQRHAYTHKTDAGNDNTERPKLVLSKNLNISILDNSDKF